MEEIFKQLQQYLDDSGDPEMMKANPNLVRDAHNKVFERFRRDFHDKPLPDNGLEILATQYFGAYLNEKGKATFFPPGFFPK